MKIVVLDGYTLNPGDLSWDELKKLGEVSVYDRCSDRSEVAQRSAGAEAILTNKITFDKLLLESLPSLKYLGVTATGYNMVDVEAARKKGIVVTNVPGYANDTVAQHVFALLLELTNHVALHAESAAHGDWCMSPDWTYTKKPIVELAGKTMGIIGFGNIGKKVGAIALAFGMNVLAMNRNPVFYPGVTYVSREDLFSQSDVISLHCPQTPETVGIVNEAMLRRMKPGALLINTSRGGLIDEKALAQALNEGWIAGAGLDVLTKEPPESDNPLLDAKRCLVTPHQAWASIEARQRLMTQATANLEAYTKGQSLNVVS